MDLSYNCSTDIHQGDLSHMLITCIHLTEIYYTHLLHTFIKQINHKTHTRPRKNKLME